MTDPRKEFEKRIASFGFDDFSQAECGCCAYQDKDTENAFSGFVAAWIPWQACQQLNDKRIADLLGVIAKQKEYIKEIKDITLCTMTENIADEALAITPENVELVEVGKVKQVGGSLFASQYSPNNGVKVGDIVYTIKTKEPK